VCNLLLVFVDKFLKLCPFQL